MRKTLRVQVMLALSACAIGLTIALIVEVRAVEEKSAWDALPEAVRATFETQRPGEVPSEIEKERENGGEVYEAKYVADGATVEIEVGADGALLEIETDDDGDDEEDDDEDEDADDE